MKKIISIQSIRALAIILIVFSHCAFVLNEKGDVFETQMGCFGVSLFIMISGFLANYKLKQQNQFAFSQNTNKISLKLFLLSLFKKITKLWPLHFFMFLLSLPLCFYLAKESIGSFVLTGVTNLTMLHGFVPIKSFYFSFNFVSWFLTLTIFFYLISPLIGFLFRINKCSLSLIFIIILSFFAAGVYLLFRNTQNYYYFIYICPLTRLIDFAIGGLTFNVVAFINNTQKINESCKKSISLLFVVMSLALAVLALIVGYKKDDPIFLSGVWVLPSVIMLLGSSIDSKWHIHKLLFENKAIVFVGNISLALFLIHQVVIRYFRFACEKIDGNINIGFICAIILSFGLAYLYNLVVSWIKNKFFKRDNKPDITQTE